jgi:uncharacterized protein YuzE
MKTTYDKDANALYVRFSERQIVESEEVRPGLIVDFDDQGRIVGLEMLDARTRLPEDALASLAAA